MEVLLRLLGIEPQVSTLAEPRDTRASAHSTRVGEVKSGACVVLRNVAGSTLTCTAGRLWITEADRDSDIDLPAGNAVHLRSGGKTLVNSCSPSTFRLDWNLPGDGERHRD